MKKWIFIAACLGILTSCSNAFSVKIIGDVKNGLNFQIVHSLTDPYPVKLHNVKVAVFEYAFASQKWETICSASTEEKLDEISIQNGKLLNVPVLRAFQCGHAYQVYVAGLPKSGGYGYGDVMFFIGPEGEIQIIKSPKEITIKN